MMILPMFLPSGGGGGTGGKPHPKRIAVLVVAYLAVCGTLWYTYDPAWRGEYGGFRPPWFWMLPLVLVCAIALLAIGWGLVSLAMWAFDS